MITNTTTQKTFVTEKALLSHLECSLRTHGANFGPESPVLDCAEKTYYWLIQEIAAGRQPTAGETRDFYDVSWQQTAYFQSRDTVPTKLYNRRLREGLRACFRIRDLLWTHEILQPVSRYELIVDGITIVGEYAALCSSRRKNHGFIPYLRHKGLRIRPVIPDIVTFARWVDASKRLPLNQWGVKRLAVMHFWVSQNLAAEYLPNSEFARQSLRGAVGTVSGPPYPRTGEHCLSCPTRNCRESVQYVPHE
jgi:hypothetical protein